MSTWRQHITTWCLLVCYCLFYSIISTIHCRLQLPHITYIKNKVAYLTFYTCRLARSTCVCDVTACPSLTPSKMAASIGSLFRTSVSATSYSQVCVRRTVTNCRFTSGFMNEQGSSLHSVHTTNFGTKPMVRGRCKGRTGSSKNTQRNNSFSGLM